jgi:signal transduction histidine kinase
MEGKSVSLLMEDKEKLDRLIQDRTRELNEKILELKQSEAATLSILEDLHETVEQLKKSKREIKQQNLKLKKLDKIKSNFLNITSHELRTPMSAIKGYIQMIIKQTLGNTTDEQQKALDTVLRNINRLDNLIQDILDISRLESGAMKFIPEKTHIPTLLNETVETMKFPSQEKNIKINTKLEANLPQITIDAGRIKQVMMNIINNAIKFSPKDTKINITVKKESKYILFVIQDQGKGIPKEKQKKIFEVFYQVDGGMDRKFGGVGLGLAICRGIVLSHGGEIWVDSTVNQGSTFCFTLPVESPLGIGIESRGIDIFAIKNQAI